MSELREEPASGSFDLPVDRPRSSARGFRADAEPLALPALTAAALGDLARLQEVPVSVVLLAALQAVLHRYSGQDEVVVSLRSRTTHPRAVRTDFSSDPTFRDVVRRVSAAWHEEKVSDLPERNSERTSVQFGFGAGSPSEWGADEYALAIAFRNEGEEHGGVVGYDAAVFDARTIRRFLNHFITLLEAAAATPDGRVGMLPLLNSAERDRILTEWNRTTTVPLPDGSVVSRFQEQALQKPNAVAAVLGDRGLSYRDLDAESNRLAHALRTLGTRPGSLVGICLERSLDLGIAVLGVLKAGAAYVALDPEYPRERLEFMLQDSQASVVLGDRHAVARLPDGPRRILTFGSESMARLLEVEPVTPVPHPPAPTDLAYVIYTSGSTGRPKGVAMPHRALANLIRWQIESSSNPSAKTLQFASLNFDVSFQEIFSTWCAGGTLLMVSEEERRDPFALWRLISDERVERLFLPFVALQQLAGAADGATVSAAALREVITAGEQLQITMQISRLFRGSVPRSLQNQYGPSETHVATAFTVEGPASSWPTLPPIGRPIANNRIYILDRHGEPVPVGVAGEIFIGGIGLALGYWKRPDLTAERFVPDPFGAASDGRLYKTGDLGRYRASGDIEFLGRLDDQVKIRGFRVEPGEIATAIAQHPGVRESVVTARQDGSGGNFLAGYFVARGSRAPRSSELRAFLKTKIPGYMVPSVFIAMTALPLTPSGKVDRRALPAPDLLRPEMDAPMIAPRDREESRLAVIWERAFGIERIGIHDDFFELGGHSLIAGRVFAQIRKLFSTDLPPTTLLQAPTIARLADVLRGDRKPERWTSLVSIQPEGSRPPLFCMHAGAGTILFYQDLARALGSDQPVYGLQAQGLYGDAAPHAEVDEMATHYAREIRTVQAEGPYYLAGFCFGGLLAFAVAEVLTREGSEVALLASFDGGSHRFDYAVRTGGGMGLDGPHEAPPSRIGRHLDRLRQMGLAERIGYIHRNVTTRLRRWLSRARDRAHLIWSDLLRRRGRALPDRLRQTYFRPNSVRASLRFKPSVYPGRMAIFETRGLFRDPHLGWDGLVAGGFDVHEISAPIGDPERYHATFIPALAGPLRDVLNKAGSERRGGLPARAAR